MREKIIKFLENNGICSTVPFCEWMYFWFGNYQLFYDVNLKRMKLASFDETKTREIERWELDETPIQQTAIVFICKELNIHFQEFDKIKLCKEN